jgi:hypothetical protein
MSGTSQDGSRGASHQREIRIAGPAVGLALDAAQTAATALEAAEMLVYSEECAEVIAAGRAAMAELVGLLRDGYVNRADGRPEGEQEDENSNSGRRRPVRGRVVSRAGAAGP